MRKRRLNAEGSVWESQGFASKARFTFSIARAYEFGAWSTAVKSLNTRPKETALCGDIAREGRGF